VCAAFSFTVAIVSFRVSVRLEEALNSARTEKLQSYYGRMSAAIPGEA
jgi:hypothetical protein